MVKSGRPGLTALKKIQRNNSEPTLREKTITALHERRRKVLLRRAAACNSRWTRGRKVTPVDVPYSLQQDGPQQQTFINSPQIAVVVGSGSRVAQALAWAAPAAVF